MRGRVVRTGGLKGRVLTQGLASLSASHVEAVPSSSGRSFHRNFDYKFD